MTSYTISRNGEQFGPYGEEDLRAHIRSGKVLPDDLAWKEGLKSWQPVSSMILVASGNAELSPLTFADTAWHYEMQGERFGPVAESEISAMVSQGRLKRESYVWQQGSPSWVRLESTKFRFHFSSTPPPLTGSAIRNDIVWWLAFAPVIGAFLGGLLGEMTNIPYSKLWWVTLALNVGLSIADENLLKKAGHDTSSMGASWLVPVYLYKRAEILKQNNAYFIVWVILFCLSLFY